MGKYSKLSQGALLTEAFTSPGRRVAVFRPSVCSLILDDSAGPSFCYILKTSVFPLLTCCVTLDSPGLKLILYKTMPCLPSRSSKRSK